MNYPATPGARVDGNNDDKSATMEMPSLPPGIVRKGVTATSTRMMTAATIDIDLSNGSSQSGAEGGDDSLLGDVSGEGSSKQERRLSQLEMENATLRQELLLMKQALAAQQQQHAGSNGHSQQATARVFPPSLRQASPNQPITAIRSSPTGHQPQHSPKRKMPRPRRWSLSSAQDPEMGAAFRREDSETLVYDELESHSSSRGLHHRKNLHDDDSPHRPKHTHSPKLVKQQQRSLDHKLSDSEDDGFLESDDEELEAMKSLVASSVPITTANGQYHHDDAASNSTDDNLLETATSFWEDVKDRAGWLVGLMVLQSMSSFIIKRNEELLEEHIIIVQFLTMLVGAGGNAGNQASVRVIRGLATGAVTDRNIRYFLYQELAMGLLLAAILGVSGCLRALVFATPLPETTAITTSLWAIVFISIAIGALLPVCMKKVGIDPAHSSTTIQVVMDILGVTITVQMSKLILSGAMDIGEETTAEGGVDSGF